MALVIFVVLVIFGAIGNACGAGSPAASSHSQAHRAHRVAASTITYLVFGAAAGGTHAEFGEDFDIHHHRIPMRFTRPLDEGALFYTLDVGLKGWGKIVCEILVNGRVVARRHVSGAGRRCSIEISQDFSGKWVDDGGSSSSSGSSGSDWEWDWD